MFYLDAWTFSYEHFKMMAFTVNMHALKIEKNSEMKKADAGRIAATCSGPGGLGRVSAECVRMQQ